MDDFGHPLVSPRSVIRVPGGWGPVLAGPLIRFTSSISLRCPPPNAHSRWLIIAPVIIRPIDHHQTPFLDNKCEPFSATYSCRRARMNSKNVFTRLDTHKIAVTVFKFHSKIFSGQNLSNRRLTDVFWTATCLLFQT